MLTRKTMWMTRAFLVLGVAVATPALGQQVADLALTVTGPASTSYNFGASKTFTASLQNLGPSTATGVKLTVTPPAGTVLTGFGGCTRDEDATTTPPTPLDSCTVADVVDFTTTAVKYTLKVPLPSPRPATCPAGVIPATAVVVTATSTDPVAANNAAIVGPGTTNPYADFETKITGPASASQGQAVTYTIQVTNLGPCTAPNAGFSSDGLSVILENQTIAGAACNLTSADWECGLGDLAPNDPKGFVYNYTMGPLPGSYYSTAVPFGGTSGSDIPDLGFTSSAAVNTAVTNTPGGCNSAEGGGLVGVLGLLGFAIRRRFS